MSVGESNLELRRTWEAAAPGWAKWEDTFAASLDEVTDVLLDMAGVVAGARVLDIACGAGHQSLRAAKRVGSNGVVVASDISATMLENVRESAERSGIHNIETLESSADDLDEGMIPFDASICRLGLMLFPSPADALQAVYRVLKPGARFAAVVGSIPAHNPFLAQPMGILLDRAGRQPPASGQPGLFALGADGVLATLLRENGLQNVQTKVARAPIRLPNASDALEMMQQAFGAYRAVVAELNEGDQKSAWADVYECLTQFEGESGFEADIEVIIGAGAKAP